MYSSETLDHTISHGVGAHGGSTHGVSTHGVGTNNQSRC
jgi:hypothetical protein